MLIPGSSTSNIPPIAHVHVLVHAASPCSFDGSDVAPTPTATIISYSVELRRRHDRRRADRQHTFAAATRTRSSSPSPTTAARRARTTSGGGDRPAADGRVHGIVQPAVVQLRRLVVVRPRQRHQLRTRGTSATARPPAPASPRATRTRSAGQYTVTLTVDDGQGGTNSTHRCSTCTARPRSSPRTRSPAPSHRVGAAPTPAARTPPRRARRAAPRR